MTKKEVDLGAKICLTLTGKTLAENIETYRRYKNYVDMVELRADFLSEEEQLNCRRFPPMIGIPCILTIRRARDGGQFVGNEFTRTSLFSRALAFATAESEKNFAYVDFEDDFNVTSLFDISLAFKVKIIRSHHEFTGPVTGLRDKFAAMQRTPNEIMKMAFMPKTLSDVTRLFSEIRTLRSMKYIICAMGPLGVVTRILATRLGSVLTYTSSVDQNNEMLDAMKEIGHIDPITLCDMYRFRAINDETKIFAVTGWPLKTTSSPLLHNTLYKKHNLNCVFIPLPATSPSEALDAARVIGMKGLAVTVPYKEKIIPLLSEVDESVGEIGSSNTIVKFGGAPATIVHYDDPRMAPRWVGHNTDGWGFKRALINFIKNDERREPPKKSKKEEASPYYQESDDATIKRISKLRIALIGAGGAAKAIAYALKTMGAKVCIFNRTLEKAEALAAKYNFRAAELCEQNLYLLEKYSDIIVQSTNVGMNSFDQGGRQNDPIWFYDFDGHEALFDIVYSPEVTPVMARARAKGCLVCNGFEMLRYQGYKQFEYFLGEDVFNQIMSEYGRR